MIEPSALPQATHYSVHTKLPFYYGMMAQLLKNKRQALRGDIVAIPNESQEFTQHWVNIQLGYTAAARKHGQFWSNIERGKCTLPVKLFVKVSRLLDIPLEELLEARLMDESITVQLQLNHFKSLDSIGLN